MTVPVAAAGSWWRALEAPDAPKIIARLPFVERADLDAMMAVADRSVSLVLTGSGDVLAGVDELIRRGVADPDRLGDGTPEGPGRDDRDRRADAEIVEHSARQNRGQGGTHVGISTEHAVLIGPHRIVVHVAEPVLDLRSGDLVSLVHR